MNTSIFSQIKTSKIPQKNFRLRRTITTYKFFFFFETLSRFTTEKCVFFKNEF